MLRIRRRAEPPCRTVERGARLGLKASNAWQGTYGLLGLLHFIIWSADANGKKAEDKFFKHQ